MYINLLSVLKGISDMLGKAPESAYVDCGKAQLDSVINGMEEDKKVPQKPIMEQIPVSCEAQVSTEEGADPEAELAKKELMG